MILVVGSSGLLGTELVRRLRGAGHEVRALVRETTEPAKREALEQLGASLVAGDLKDPASLARACAGARAVLSTASSTSSRRDGDTIDSVDRSGQLALVEAAEAAGVEQFVFVSFPKAAPDHPLQQAKAAVAERLEASPMRSTVLMPSYFTEVWLSPALGFDVANAKARVLGSGDAKLSPISFMDVASFCVAALDNPAAANRSFELGGPDLVSIREIIAAFEGATGRGFEIEQVPEAALEPQLSAESPLERSFAAMMLAFARGGAVDSSAALEVMPVERRSLQDFVAASTGGT